VTWTFSFVYKRRLGAAGSMFVALRLVYLIFIKLLGAIALLLRSDVSKEAEILRHQPAVRSPGPDHRAPIVP
jgi:hypothetical protein